MHTHLFQDLVCRACIGLVHPLSSLSVPSHSPRQFVGCVYLGWVCIRQPVLAPADTDSRVVRPHQLFSGEWQVAWHVGPRVSPAVTNSDHSNM